MANEFLDNILTHVASVLANGVMTIFGQHKEGTMGDQFILSPTLFES